MEVDLKECANIIDKYDGDRGALIAILQDTQEKYRYLPLEALQEVSKKLGISLIDIYGIATFYRWFRLKPVGNHLVTVCMGTACHVRGAPKVLEEFERKLGIKPGETTEDQEFSLETVNCLGCCAIGPIVVVDEEYHGHTKISKVGPILKKYRKSEKEK